MSHSEYQYEPYSSESKFHLAKSELLQEFLTLGVLKLSVDEPFIYASGLKGPVYCDNRLIWSHVQTRQKVLRGLIYLLKGAGLDQLPMVGVATAGLPHGAFLAQLLGTPFLYAREKPKGHGQKKSLEGDVRGLTEAVLVEDLINQGKSSLAVLKQVRSEGLAIKNIVSVMNYDFSYVQKSFRQVECDIHSLFVFSELLLSAEQSGYLKKNDLVSLQDWHTDPAKWSERFSDT